MQNLQLTEKPSGVESTIKAVVRGLQTLTVCMSVIMMLALNGLSVLFQDGMVLQHDFNEF